MKKVLFYIAALTLAVGCADNAIDEPTVETTTSSEMVSVNLSLTLEGGASDTRATVNTGETDDDPWTVEWEDGDMILVYSLANNDYTFLTYVADGNEGGTFSGSVYPGENRIYHSQYSWINTSVDDDGNSIAILYSDANFTDGDTPTMISSEVVNFTTVDADGDGYVDETFDVYMQQLGAAIDLKVTFTGIPEDLDISPLSSIMLGTSASDDVSDEYVQVPYIIYVRHDKSVDDEDFIYSSNEGAKSVVTSLAIENDTEYSQKFEVLPFTFEADKKLCITFSFNDGLISKSFDFTNNSGADFEFARATHSYLQKTYDLSDIGDDVPALFAGTWAADAVAFADTTSAGTVDDPIEITSEAELAYLAKISTGLYKVKSDGVYYKLTADLDLDGKEWYPIGSYYTHFTGHFDGDGHSISNLTINATSTYQGLFGYVENGSISSVVMKEPNITSTSSNVGVICGRLMYDSTISNCSVEGGSISGTALVGGICAASYWSESVGGGTPSIVGCSVDGVVISGTLTSIGGIGAMLTYCSVSDCSVENSSVTGTAYVGGICGRLSTMGVLITNCSVKDSYVTGTSGNYVGGVIGYTGATISYCSVEGGSVEGAGYGVGGICGSVYAGIVKNCYNTGTVTSTGSFDVGGIAGIAYSVISCYNIGKVSGTEYVGGIVGDAAYASVISCYNTGEVSATTGSFGGILGITYDDLTSSSYYLSSTADNGYGEKLSSVSELNAKVGEMNEATNTALGTTGISYYTAGEGNVLPSLMGEAITYGDATQSGIEDISSAGGLSN